MLAHSVVFMARGAKPFKANIQHVGHLPRELMQSVKQAATLAEHVLKNQ